MKGAIRLLVWSLAVVLVALPVVGVLRGWFAADRWPVTRLTVQAEFKHLSAEQIRAAVRPHLGKGFFAVNLDAVQQAVAALPWVESVEARKHWPDTLQLRIYERQPFAHWNGGRLISRLGQVYAPADAEEVQGLPQLQGPDTRLAEVVSFYAETSKQFAAHGMKVTGVTLTDRGSWSVATAAGSRVVIGERDQVERRLRRFLGAYPQLMRGHEGHFAYADLRYANGFAVRWADPASASAGDAPRT